MWEKQLRRPIQTLLLRRALLPSVPASVPFLSHNFSSLHSPSYNFLFTPRFSQIPKNQFLPAPRFSWKCFYSEPASADKGRSCWNCSSPTPFLVCQSCQCVQPVDHSIDYFQIFGLEKTYEIEVGSLEGKYKDWQKKLHPDLVHTKSEMRIEGVGVEEEKTVSEPELLAEIMEIREAVEEAMGTHVLNQIKSQMQHKLRHWSDSFANAFRSKKYDEALTSIQRMTYYDRINKEIVKKL